MIFEWLAREGGIVLSWWALVTLAGVAALPLCMRLLGGLPDRGYTLSRAAGLLVVGFVYWLLATLGFVRNTTGGMVLAWVIVLVVALTVYLSGTRFDLRAWWRENRAVIITGELLFAVLFLGWAIVRAHQHGIVATEKPMELAFISATMRSETFPPNDPWMSGYAISYYYFGYVMAAMLSMLSGIPSTVGFNMMITLLFALTGLTAFGVVYNLVRSGAFPFVRSASRDDTSTPRSPSRVVALLTGLLGTVFVVLLGNYQVPIIEIPYETSSAPVEYFQFWDNDDRYAPRSQPAADITQWDYWWWFRGARVLNDRYLPVEFPEGSDADPNAPRYTIGERTEVIDEFPQFSFLLADVHPHVLSLPFATLALGLAVNVLMSGRSPERREIIFYSVCLGGLIFLNTWDGPIYTAVVVGADGVRRLIRGGTGRLSSRDLRQMITLFVSLLVLGAIFYLPFILNFRSQLGGALPNLVFPTAFQQYFIMFGPLLLILVPFLLVEIWRAGKRMNWSLGIQSALTILFLLIAAMLLLTLIGWLIPSLRSDVLNFVESGGGWGVVLPAVVFKRITHIVTTVVLVGGLVVLFGRLFPRQQTGEETDRHVVTYSPSAAFALLLVGAGILLTLIPEFVYLRDFFGTRMNTVFKLYYQAWVMFSIAGAYAVYSMFAEDRVPALAGRAAYGLLAVVAISLGMLYPVLGIYHRMFIETNRLNNLAPDALTLDGGYTTAFGDEYAAVQCLSELLQGDDYVVVEAVGGSYDSNNPPSGLSGKIAGIPNLFNWPFHEMQWRGGTFSEIAGTREQDIDMLYRDPTWNTTQEIINRYGIDFIFFGTHERQKYGADAEIKFRDRLEIVCERGNSRYYRVGEQSTPLG